MQQAPSTQQTNSSGISVATTPVFKTTPILLRVALCSNCGINSKNRNVCTYCKRPINTTTSMLQPQRTYSKSAPVITPQVCDQTLPPSNFYGKGGLHEFQRYLTVENGYRKRTSNITHKPPKSAECIMISDSSDEDAEVVITSVCKKNIVSASSITNQVPRDTTPKKARLVEPAADLQDSILQVRLKSVQIGQLQVTPSAYLRVSEQELLIPLDFPCSIKWFALEMIEMSCNPSEPCLYITVNDNCLASFRSMFQMTPGKFPYYDPHGPDDQKYVILYIEKIWFENHVPALRNLLHDIRINIRKPVGFFREITVVESNRRQTSAAVTSVNDTSSTPSSSSPNVRVTRRTCRRPNDDNDLRVVFSGPRVQLAIYPPPPATGGILITTEDEFCLNEGEYLNDVIIDFYLKYTMQELLSDVDRERSHVFSCFFFKRLTQLQGRSRQLENKNLSMSLRRHMRVRKWTRGVDLFSKDFIFIPINDANHWYLAVICFPGQRNVFEIVEESKSLPENRSELIISDIRSLNNAKIESKDDMNVAENNTTAENNVLAAPMSNAIKCFLPDGVTSNNTENTVILNENSSTNRPTESKTLNSNSAINLLTENNVNEILPMSVDDETEVKQTCIHSNSSASNLNDCSRNTSACDEHLSGHGSPDISQSSTSVTSVHDKPYFKQPCILIFDSLRGCTRSATATFLRDYLTEEWKFRKEAEFGARIFDKNTIKMCTPKVPQQNNYTDCGLFLLHYVEKMFEKPIDSYALPITTLQNWFSSEEIKMKRSRIKKIIKDLSQQSSASSN